MNRRNFFSTVAAAIAARRLPKSKPAPLRISEIDVAQKTVTMASDGGLGSFFGAQTVTSTSCPRNMVMLYNFSVPEYSGLLPAVWGQEETSCNT